MSLSIHLPNLLSRRHHQDFALRLCKEKHRNRMRTQEKRKETAAVWKSFILLMLLIISSLAWLYKFSEANWLTFDTEILLFRSVSIFSSAVPCSQELQYDFHPCAKTYFIFYEQSMSKNVSNAFTWKGPLRKLLVLLSTVLKTTRH